MKTDRILENLYEVSEEYPLQLCITLNPSESIIKQAMQETAVQFMEWVARNDWHYIRTTQLWFNADHPAIDKTTAELFTIFNNEE